MTGVSRNTIKSYLKRFKQIGLYFEDVNQLSDEGLAELILGPLIPVQQSDRLVVLLSKTFYALSVFVIIIQNISSIIFQCCEGVISSMSFCY